MEGVGGIPIHGITGGHDGRRKMKVRQVTVKAEKETRDQPGWEKVRFSPLHTISIATNYL